MYPPSYRCSQVLSNWLSGKTKKHFFLNSLMMQDDREWLMPTVSQLSKIRIKAVERRGTPHRQAIEDQV